MCVQMVEWQSIVHEVLEYGDLLKLSPARFQDKVLFAIVLCPPFLSSLLGVEGVDNVFRS